MAQRHHQKTSTTPVASCNHAQDKLLGRVKTEGSINQEKEAASRSLCSQLCGVYKRPGDAARRLRISDRPFRRCFISCEGQNLRSRMGYSSYTVPRMVIRRVTCFAPA